MVSVAQPSAAKVKVGGTAVGRIEEMLAQKKEREAKLAARAQGQPLPGDKQPRPVSPAKLALGLRH